MTHRVLPFEVGGSQPHAIIGFLHFPEKVKRLIWVGINAEPHFENTNQVLWFGKGPEEGASQFLSAQYLCWIRISNPRHITYMPAVRNAKLSEAEGIKLSV